MVKKPIIRITIKAESAIKVLQGFNRITSYNVCYTKLLRITERSDVISFAGGLPAPELFPIEAIKRVSQLVLDEQGPSALQYSTTEGYEPLRAS